ncbi:MAG: DUF559 domain-containing protein [Planctomycetota bacterium]|nr:DUF559 domain-containing protein [Planctomycetota bacterium]
MRTELTPFARKLRQSMPHMEAVVWKYVRNRQLGGFKFRRQQPLGPFVADFFCAEAKVVPELEGEVHRGKEAADEARADWLRRKGYLVVRVPNDLAFNRLSKILDDVQKACEARRATNGTQEAKGGKKRYWGKK